MKPETHNNTEHQDILPFTTDREITDDRWMVRKLLDGTMTGVNYTAHALSGTAGYTLGTIAGAKNEFRNKYNKGFHNKAA